MVNCSPARPIEPSLTPPSPTTSARRAHGLAPGRKVRLALGAALLGAAAAGGVRADAGTLDLVTGDDFGDFSGRDLDRGGMATEIVREAFAAMGHDVRITFDGWQAGYDATLAGEHDGAFPWYFLPERTEAYLYTDSIYELVERVFHLEGDPDVPPIRGASDLAGLTLCYPAGWGAPPSIQAMFDAGRTERVEPGDMSRCFDLLADERVDAVLSPQLQGYATVEAHPELDAFDVATASWEVTVRTLSLLLPKAAGRERACEHAVGFAAGLATVRANGLFDAVARRWFGSLAQLAPPQERYELVRRTADGGTETLSGAAIGLSAGRFLIDAGERGIERVALDEIAWIGRTGLDELEASRDWCVAGDDPAGDAGGGDAGEGAADAIASRRDGPLPGRTLAVAGRPDLANDLAPALLSGWLERPLEARGDGFEVVDASNDPREPDRLEVRPGTTAEAFAALAGGAVQLALADRPPTAAERAALREAYPPVDDPAERPGHVFALEALAPIVHRSRRVDAIGLDALAEALAGGRLDWGALGATEGSRGRASVHVDEALAQSLAAGFAGRLPAPGASVVRHGSADAVLAAVGADPDALGLVRIEADGTHRGVDGVRTVSLADCGLVHAPTAFAARSEEYPLVRRLSMHHAPGTAGGAAGAFVRHAQGADGASAVLRHALVDLAIVPESAADRVGKLVNRARSGARDPSVVAGLDRAVDGARRLSTTFRFLTGSARLDARATRDAERLAGWLGSRGLDGSDLLLVGYADARGGYDRNCVLSGRRAASAAAALAREGVERAIRTLGACEEAPVACNATPAGRELNRRVEVWVRGTAALDDPPPTAER